MAMFEYAVMGPLAMASLMLYTRRQGPCTTAAVHNSREDGNRREEEDKKQCITVADHNNKSSTTLFDRWFALNF